MIPKWVADSCRNRWPDHPEICTGLPASARLIEWVRHTHAGNVENHFVIPRIHLRTGRYFNAYPPCSAQDFNVLKAFMDTKYGLTANTSIEHQQLFGHVGPYDPQRKLKLKIYEQLELFCSQNGQSITRDSVKDFFEDTYIKQLFSLKEIKQKHDYLQVFIEGKTKAIRLTGAAFQQPRKSGLPQEDLPSLHQKLLQVIRKRARFNRSRWRFSLYVLVSEL